MGPRRIEILILLFTFALIIAVAVTGVFTFNNLSIIEKQTQRITQPNQTIICLKQLLSELRNSENCVRAYGLYNNIAYLSDYQQSLREVDRCFDSLFSYQHSDDRMMALLDTTEKLVEKKILLLNRQLSLRNEETVVDEVNRIRRKLDKFKQVDTVIVTPRMSQEPPAADASEAHPDAGASKVQKKKSFFSRLFRKKESDKESESGENVDAVRQGGRNHAAVDCVRVVLNRGSVEEVKSEVQKVRHQQSRLFSLMKEEELKLVEEDKQIWTSLIEILTRLESVQTDLMKTIAADNIQKTSITHRFMKAFGILILFMLGFLGFFSLYYFYRVRKHRDQLGREMERSKMLARAKEEFLANMSHEMRTPLNAITGFAEQLRASPLNPEQEKQLEIISSASSHLLNLINDVLDLSKIEADKFQFENIAFDPIEQIREAIDILRPKADFKNLQTILSFADNVPDRVSGDPLRLRQVILNLFSNAIKFTEKGHIKISVFCEKRPEELDPQKTELHVMVEDSGIGISEEMQTRVFENFTQADSSISRKYGGTGLGLSITRKIIELQGGEISLNSRPGAGTRITFRIPYQIQYREAGAQPESQQLFEARNTAGKKVLIADDELFNRILLITILKRWGVEYDEVQNGREVLEKVAVTDYDLILMDVRMPEVSGIEACRTIRQMSDPKKAAVPVIALTATTSEDKKEKCLEAGMNGLITKPYNEKELIRLIERIFAAKADH